MNSLFGSRKDKISLSDRLDPKGGLERLCAADRDRVIMAPLENGIERVEAHYQGNGFSPHRHDSYAIGLTLKGVNSFQYRGDKRYAQWGEVVVLHPDELHDGEAGTDDGFLLSNDVCAA